MTCNLIWSGALWILTISPGTSRVEFLARIARFDTRTGRLLDGQCRSGLGAGKRSCWRRGRPQTNTLGISDCDLCPFYHTEMGNCIRVTACLLASIEQ